jgi:two-component system response regulator (stage 0 sporulation protein F)
MDHRQPIILVVDPDADRATSLSCRLDLGGYRVLRRASGIDALQCVKEYRPELVLSEVDLLDLEGPELRRSIHEISPSTQILVITRPGWSPRLQEEMKPDLVTLPFIPSGVDEVLRAVDRLLEGVHVRATPYQAC